MLKEMKSDKLLAVDRSTFALSLAARKLGRGQIFSRGGSHGMLQVTLAFWLVLAYDLLENRCTIDVIAKFFPSVFKNGGKFCEFR